MTPLEFLARLQAEAAQSAKQDRKRSRDFHPGLNAWVDDNSSVARALRAMAAPHHS